VGLCGNFNGRSMDDFEVPGGVVETGVVPFVQAYTANVGSCVGDIIEWLPGDTVQENLVRGSVQFITVDSRYLELG